MKSLLAIWALTGGIWMNRPAPYRCKVASLTVHLHAREDWQHKIGKLTFSLHFPGPGFCNGWTFTLQDRYHHDLIYPVNPPLRFNPSLFLGCAYGLSASQGLQLPRRLRFILHLRDYRRIQPLMKFALWPGTSADPRHAAKKYEQALASIPTGLLLLQIPKFTLTADGRRIRTANIRVTLIAPAGFSFGKARKTVATSCPSRTPGHRF